MLGLRDGRGLGSLGPDRPAVRAGPQVAVGDTAESIANKFGVYLEALKLANPQIDNFGNLRVGTVLNIPLPGFRPPSTASPNPS